MGTGILILASAVGCGGGGGSSPSLQAGIGGAGAAARSGAGGAGGDPGEGGVGGSQMAGSAGAPIMGSGRGAEGDVLAACAGFDISREGVLDLDLKAVSVSGAVTANGSPLPDATDRGQIEFVDALGLVSATVALGATGPARYAVRMPPGVYSVRYVASEEGCADPARDGLPCNGGPVLTSVPIAQSGVLDIDVPVVMLSGRVTVNGLPYPDQTTSRGALSFGSEQGSTAVTASFGSEGPVTYSIRLIPGTYDVRFVADSAQCTASAQAPPGPCVSATLMRSVEVQSGVLDLDLRVVRILGSVTVNGQPMPEEAMARGSLLISEPADEEAEGASTTHSFGATGQASYGVSVIAGTYDVAFVPNPGLCSLESIPSVPCTGATLLPRVRFAQDGVLDIDVPAVTLRGSVTLLGAALPDAGADRGSIELRNAAGGLGVIPLGTTGALAYALRVVAGSYDVVFAANPELCASSTAAGMPCTGATLMTGVAIETDGALDLDLRRVLISGAVTLAGAPLPDATDARGAIRFVSSAGEAALTASLDSTGAASYAVALWPGRYDVGLQANAALCGLGIDAPELPCVGGVLRTGVAADVDGVLDLDLRPIRVGGTVTVNGQPMPPEASERGLIRWRRVASEGGDSATIPLGASESASYGVTVLPGAHVAVHEGNSGLCAPGAPLPTTPCASQVVIGCGSGSP